MSGTTHLLHVPSQPPSPKDTYTAHSHACACALQNTTLGEFTEAVAQAGPSLPCGGSTCSAASSRIMHGSFATNSFASNASSFRIGAPQGLSRCPSGASNLSGFSGCSSLLSGLSTASSSAFGSFAGHQGGAATATADAAAAAAAAAFALDHPAAAGSGDWSLGSYEASVAAASRAAYAAAAAAYSTVMATLGLDSSSEHPAGGKKAALPDLFSKHFGSGVSSVVPVYDAHIRSMPGLSGFSLGAPAGSKGPGLKPLSFKQELSGETGVPADQVKPAVWLCTLVQLVGMLLISGTMHALTVLPMLGWM